MSPNLAKEGGYDTAKGIITRLVRDQGYGFIRTEDGRGLFFHRIDLQRVGYESLREGQQEFQIVQTPKGLEAVKVRLVGQTS